MTEQTLINNQMRVQAEYDAKKYHTGYWLGQPGGSFNTVFQPAWEQAMHGVLKLLDRLISQ